MNKTKERKRVQLLLFENSFLSLFKNQNKYTKRSERKIEHKKKNLPRWGQKSPQ